MDPLAWLFALLAAVLFACGALCIRARDARIARLEDQVRRLRWGNAALLDRLHYQERPPLAWVDREYKVHFEEME